jgi:2-octaprenyl-6-methoxyphenol hydroxylase
LLKTHETDIVIVGGGLIGGALAKALAPLELNVCIVDQAPALSQQHHLDTRTTAIAAASADVLRAWGIWERLEPEAEEIWKIVVSDRHYGAALTFDPQEFSQTKPMGWMVHNKNLREAIAHAAGSIAGMEWFYEQTCEKVTHSESHICLVTNKCTIQAKLLIGADGRGSWIRGLINPSLARWHYDQIAVTALLHHPNEHNGVAVEHFTSMGPLAFLPMQGRTSGLVWSLKPHLLPQLMGDPAQALALINGSFEDHRGPITHIDGRREYPLEVILPKNLGKRRIVLVGDAAHCIHPVAGQGLNLGLRDVKRLAESISWATSLGLDIGSGVVIDRYTKASRPDHVSMTAVTDGLVRLFGLSSEPATFVRKMGMKAVNLLPFIKKRLMLHAMGY